MADENTPLLNDDTHSQLSSRTLYNRATRKRKSQSMTYSFTAALSNTLLLSQVVLGATLTALGASESSHVLITIFGVLNTIIAGLVAYLKSRGQPMRARMFRDDLEHVVDEIENSKTMWLGIKKSVHGYDEIDVDDKISVRSEVARLTRLYETAVKKYMQNNPDMYSMGGGMLDAITGLRARPGAGAQLPPVVNAPDAGAATTAVPAPLAASPAPAGDADESPATAKDPAKNDKSAEESPATAKDDTKSDDKGKEKDELTNPTANANQHDDADATAGATSKEGTEQADSEPASAPVKSNEDDLPSKDDHNGDGEAPTKPKDDPVNGK